MPENKLINDEETAEVKVATTDKPAAKTNLPKNLTELLEAGAHFGHQTRRWNPKMGRFIYTAKNGVHIIDLTKTVTYLEEAKRYVRQLAASGGRILFVGTKRQGRDIIAKAATEAEMPYVNQRWLGGMLTNLQTISSRVARLKKLEVQHGDNAFTGLTKKERSELEAEHDQLAKLFTGIKDMNELPDALFVVDMPREDIAVSEAHKLNIPVIAMVDTNADPDLADYPIPSNDDAIKSITLIVHQVGEAAKEGKALYDAKTKETKREGGNGHD